MNDDVIRLHYLTAPPRANHGWLNKLITLSAGVGLHNCGSSGGCALPYADGDCGHRSCRALPVRIPIHRVVATGDRDDPSTWCDTRKPSLKLCQVADRGAWRSVSPVKDQMYVH